MDIDRAIIDWGYTGGSTPDWPLGICGTNPTTCISGIEVTGSYVIVSGLETRNMLIQAQTGTGSNDEEQGVYYEIGGSHVTISNAYLHGVFNDCTTHSNCNSVDENHNAIDMGAPYDEAANDIVENGDAAVLGTSGLGYCYSTEDVMCTTTAFGIGTGTQSGAGPVSAHGNKVYADSWQLRLAGNNASGNDPYLSYGNEFWLTSISTTQHGHINARYMQSTTPVRP